MKLTADPPSKPDREPGFVSEIPDKAPLSPRPFVTNRIVIALLVVLVAAVLVQAALLTSLFLKDRLWEKRDSASNDEIASSNLLEESVLQTDSDSSSEPLTLDPLTLDPLTLGPSTLDPFEPPSPGDFFLDSWDPFSGIDRMHERMDRLFDDSFSGLHQMPNLNRDWLGADSAESISSSVMEEDDRYIATFDLPGADDSTVKVTLQQNVLTVSGNRNAVTEEKDADGNVVGRSSSSASFQQTLTLPGAGDAAKMTSEFDNGVLTVTIPKSSSL